MTFHSMRFLAAVCAVSAVATAQRFDLADTIGRRNSEPAGQGQPFHYPIQRAAYQGLFIPESAVVGVTTYSPFVHGIFVPQDQTVGMSHVADGVGGVPIMLNIPAVGTIPSPAWASDGSPSNDGALRINDPSGLNGHPDYTASPYHSILATHAAIGVTFDIAAIRADMGWFGPLQFTGNPGGSCTPVSAIAVVVDAADQARVVFSQRGMSGNNLSPMGFVLGVTDKFFCLIGGDDIANTINCKHMFWGDPFLTPAYNGSVAHYGTGCPTSSSVVPAIHVLGVPCLGSSLSIACEGPTGLSWFLSLGFSNIQSGGLSLPFDLGGIGGVAGCRVLGSLEVTTGAVPTNSSAVTLTVPVAPILLGAHLYAQCYVLDLGLGVAVPFATSAAADLMFGN